MPLVFYSDTGAGASLPIRVAGSGIDYVTPSAARPSIQIPQILITTGGVGLITVNDETFEIPVGYGFYLGRGVEYHYRPQGNDWRVDWIEFDYTSAMESDGLFISQKFALIQLADVQSYREKIRSIYDEISIGKANSAYIASAKMYSLLIDLSCEMISVPAAPVKKSPAIDAIIEYINDNYMNEITLAELCEAAGGISEQYLCRLFKQATRMRPIEYILKKRIGIARSYLEKTDMPISEIVARSGFNNTSYFYRNFKRFTGKSPLSYRQSAMGITLDEAN